MKSAICALALCTASIFSSTATLAEDFHWPSRPISLYENKKPLNEVLSNLALGAGVSVNINKSIIEPVSFKFVDTEPEKIFKTLVTAYGLSHYYDGSRLYIDRLENNVATTVQLENISVKVFRRHLERLGVISANSTKNFKWNAIEHKKVVNVSGPEAFVKKISAMVPVLDKESKNTTLVYRWVDRKGVINLTENANNAPANAQVLEM